MKQQPVHFIGVDISKESLEIFCGSLKLATTIANTPKAVEGLIKRLNKQQPESLHVLCEATGGYEKTLLRAFWAAKIGVSLLNPKKVRHFAKALGLLAKTDKIDARLLTEYGQKINPKFTEPPTAVQERLEELVGMRDHLQSLRIAEVNRLEHLEQKDIIKIASDHIDQIDKQIKQVDKMLKDLVEKESEIKEKVECLSSIKGVGFVTSVSLLASVPELGTLSRRVASALTGVAPMNQDSGKYKGKRRIQGGRHLARKSLYMAALVASRTNPVFSNFYQRLLKRGKAAKVALTAIMRKLVCLANKLLQILAQKASKNNTQVVLP